MSSRRSKRMRSLPDAAKHAWVRSTHATMTPEPLLALDAFSGDACRNATLFQVPPASSAVLVQSSAISACQSLVHCPESDTLPASRPNRGTRPGCAQWACLPDARPAELPDRSDAHRPDPMFRIAPAPNPLVSCIVCVQTSIGAYRRDMCNGMILWGPIKY